MPGQLQSCWEMNCLERDTFLDLRPSEGKHQTDIFSNELTITIHTPEGSRTGEGRRNFSFDLTGLENTGFKGEVFLL